MKKIGSQAKKVFLAYWNNVFDGRITTLVGVLMIAFGIYRAFHEASFAEVTGYILGGLGVAGFKDPGTTPKSPQP